jgi:hypothetical protein
VDTVLAHFGGAMFFVSAVLLMGKMVTFLDLEVLETIVD